MPLDGVSRKPLRAPSVAQASFAQLMKPLEKASFVAATVD
jgi:hypothetical protein